ncbi:MAG: class I SAM-dependent methyltransferase [Lachnospiraceae bacterium]|nr:class I SAM-dependent methyltransferase [Lachnospiraceae bacterium]
MEQRELFDHYRSLWEHKKNKSGLSHTEKAWNERADEWAKELDKDSAMSRVTGRRVSEAIRLLTAKNILHPEADVIDIGCGPGRFVAEFAERSRHAAGTDISPKMLQFGSEYCREKGIDNVSFTACDFKNTTVEEMGWNKRFDLVFSCMTPAVSSFDSLEKMIAMSRGYCCNTCCIDSKSRLETEIARIFDLENTRPFWNGDWFYSLLNLVWLLGYYPETDYYTLDYTEPRHVAPGMVRDKLKRMCPGGEFSEEQIEQVCSGLSALSENGIFTDICTNRYGTVLWDTRVMRPAGSTADQMPEGRKMP